MTKLKKRIQRESLETYKHYGRTIVISLFADTISLRLKGTRTSYAIAVSHLLDDLCRRAAWRHQMEKRKARRQKK
jgi:hypothetical protein